jgi:glucose/arabinose dehydrogenase/PKD repeat protein
MRLRALSAAAAVGFAGIALVWAAGSAEAATLPGGFEEQTVASGLSLPTAIAWAPDGRLFVAQKKGVVRVVNSNGTITQLLDISSHVYGIADRGLLGIATDADFATNHWLYLLYVYQPTPAPSGSERTSRLTRVTVNDDNTASSETVILGSAGTTSCPAPSNSIDCIPADSDSHAIGTVRSAPDGTLWVGTGDGADWSRVDPRALRSYDEQSFAGKLIHVDRSGMGLPGHAFCPEDSDLAHVCTKLYAKGLRNPFRFTLRGGTDPVVGDVGWEQHEEIDLMTAPGRDYGWPCYEARAHTSGYQDLAECQIEYAKEGTAEAATLPDYDYSHDPNYQGAVIAGPVYTGGPYPDDFDGDVFFGDYANAFIKRLQIDAQGDVMGAVAFGTGAVPVDLELGPGNEIFYVDFGDGNPGTGSVKRIVYVPQNRTPVPQAAASPSFGPPPLTVNFSGAGSSDPDGNPLTYEWDFGDGTDHSTKRDPTHVYAGAGEFAARLTVTDDKGASASTTVGVSVGNSPPVVTIESPVDGSQYLVGDTIELRGSATDAEDGRLSGPSLAWQASLIHKTHTHDLAGLTGERTSFPGATDHDADAHYRITLVATDSAGRTGTKQIEIYPRAVNLTLASSPPGAPVTYAGTTAAAPVTRSSAIQFVSSISAAPSFTSGTTTYVFAGWSDGGARAHNITIPSTDETLTALYQPQSLLDGEATPLVAAPVAPARSAPSTTLDPALRMACSKARARRKSLRRRASQAEREARRAKRLLRAARPGDEKLRERYLAKHRRLRRLETRLDHVASAVRFYC